MLTKYCPRCENHLPLDRFGKQSAAKDGLQGYCKDCLREYKAEKTYGISQEEYDALMDAQGHRCAICGTHENANAGHTRFVIDHDHITDEVRGLLCDSCNVGLGRFKDSTSFLAMAIVYLETAQKKRIEKEETK